jgi:hypothetical protein
VLLDARTDAAGRYRFDNLPPGSYVVTPSIAWARSSPVSVRADDVVELDVRVAFDTVVTGLMMLPGGGLRPRRYCFRRAIVRAQRCLFVGRST